MFPRLLSNCQEDVHEFLPTISNFSELDIPQLKPSNPHAQEYPNEVLNILAEANFMPSGHFSVVDVEIIAYISAAF